MCVAKNIIKQFSNLCTALLMTGFSNWKRAWLFQCAHNNVLFSIKFAKGHFIAGAMDNVDHTLSFTTAVSSFHGTDN